MKALVLQALLVIFFTPYVSQKLVMQKGAFQWTTKFNFNVEILYIYSAYYVEVNYSLTRRPVCGMHIDCGCTKKLLFWYIWSRTNVNLSLVFLSKAENFVHYPNHSNNRNSITLCTVEKQYNCLWFLRQ